MEYLFCPDCESGNILVASIEKWEVNTGDFYCHSVKTHDSDAPVNCQDCGWFGERMQLIEGNK